MHGARWFTLRLAMGYVGVGLMLVVALVSGYILLNAASYAPAAIVIAEANLVVDMLGLGVSLFKVVLEQGGAGPLKPFIGICSDRTEKAAASITVRGERLVRS